MAGKADEHNAVQFAHPFLLAGFCATQSRRIPWKVARTRTVSLEVWPESHWPGFALRKADVFQCDMAW